jgi:hypothetical protein
MFDSGRDIEMTLAVEFIPISIRDAPALDPAVDVGFNSKPLKHIISTPLPTRREKGINTQLHA